MTRANWKLLTMRLVVIFNVTMLGTAGVAFLLLYPLALFLGAAASGGPNVTGGQTAAITIVVMLGPGLFAAACVWAIARSIRNPDSAVFIAGVIVIVIAVFHAPLLTLASYVAGGSGGGTGPARLELTTP